jgi:cytoskeletal protein RodZ
LRQISLREIAEATKINLRYLDALERDDFRHLPGGVFNKGFVRAYAQFIGIDPESMVTAYLEEDGRQQSRAARTGATAPPATEAVAPVRPLGVRLWFAAVVVILILVLLAAGLTALGYGPLASRFKSLRTSETPAAGSTVGGFA